MSLVDWIDKRYTYRSAGAKNEKTLQIAIVGARLPRPMGRAIQPLRAEQLDWELGFTILVQPNLYGSFNLWCSLVKMLFSYFTHHVLLSWAYCTQPAKYWGAHLRAR